MLVELGVVEQRYDAVKEVLEERGTVTEVAERYGVTRQSLHNWLRLPGASGNDMSIQVSSVSDDTTSRGVGTR